MKMIKIIQKENPLLRKKAKPVPVSKIKTAELKKIIQTMKDAVHSEADAVAIAAPQIGILLRLFVVSGAIINRRAEKITKSEENPPSANWRRRGDEVSSDLVFINPEIIRQSKKERETEEGCLSVRWWYGKVKRAEKMTIRALDENGKTFTRGASELLAQIFQHEIDHLNGILFTDKARELHEMLPPQSSVDK